MYIYVNETVSAGIDCVSPIVGNRHIVYGWLMYPAGEDISVKVAGQNGDCVVEYFFRHPRVDVLPSGATHSAVTGFTLVFDAGAVEGDDLTLTFFSPRFALSADLQDRSINNDLFAATTSRDWRATFQLLGRAAELAESLPLLRYQKRAFGIFADWVPKLPTMPSRFEQFSWLEQFSATASPAGEICLQATLSNRPADAATIDFTILAFVRPDEVSPAEVLFPKVAALHARSMGARCCIYGQFDAGWIKRLRLLELVVQVTCDNEALWFRCGVEPVSLPAFLDSLGNMPGNGLAVMNPDGNFMLDDVLQSREAAFLPAVTDEEALTSPRDNGAAVTGVVLDVDGVHAIRMINVARQELDSLFDKIVLVGPSAPEAAQNLEANGIRAMADAEPAVALRNAIEARSTVVVATAEQFGIAMATGTLPDLLTKRIPAERIRQLLTLHRVAGDGGKGLAESLERLLRFQKDGAAADWEPVRYQWKTPAAAYLVNAHFEKIWRGALGRAE